MSTTYHSCARKQVAYAYGFADFRPVCSRIRGKLHTLTEEQLKQLGKWTGNTKLMPDQVEIIVLLMGKPSHPSILFTT